MNTISDTLLHDTEEKADIVRQERQKAELHAPLVELGKVSDTKGSFIGAKFDTGSGFVYY